MRGFSHEFPLILSCAAEEEHSGGIPDTENTPRELRWADVNDFYQLDDRVSAVTILFGSVIGVSDGSVQWCPDDNPPTEQERLA